MKKDQKNMEENMTGTCSCGHCESHAHHNSDHEEETGKCEICGQKRAEDGCGCG